MDFKNIKDVKIKNLNQISDNRGSVLHMLRADSEEYDTFGEIYFSTLNKDKIKAWNKHLKMKSNIVCIYGSVEMILFDDRDPKKSKLMKINLSRKNYFLVTIPKLIWYGFKNISESESILCNCSSIPHDKNELLKKNFDDGEIPFRWK
jgi:dTDP-4-dehydrorhamnose 3,5-epimerase